ncbi:MAG: LpxI family protein, partial [Pseudomonadota bacterium]|nr:LpxI family protein [Pseudomonadota bacterium]
MDSKLGILAGGGELPGRLIQICRDRGRPFHVIAIEGHADPEVIGDSPQTWLRLGAAQKALEVARKEKLDEIVMVGPVRRPSIVALRPDALAARVLAKAGASSVMGDDGLLKAIIRQIEDFGFKVIGPHELLQDDM